MMTFNRKTVLVIGVVLVALAWRHHAEPQSTFRTANLLVDHTSTFGGHLITSGTSPTLGVDCGPGTDVLGTDEAGTVHFGTPGTTCTITFADTYGVTPTCVLMDRDGNDNIGKYTVSPTAIVYTPPTVSLGSLDYICIGH